MSAPLRSVSVALVFGYGSLMSSASAARTLGREPVLVPAVLRGWRRSWTAATPTALDRRYRCTACGGVPPGSMVVLDLVRDPAGTCAGVVLACDERELAALDERERRYERVELDRATLRGDLPEGRVWTYCRRSEHVLGEGADAWVAAGYLEVVERAAALLPGGLDAYRADTLAPAVPVRAAAFRPDAAGEAACSC